jgi:hypothetical protein
MRPRKLGLDLSEEESDSFYCDTFEAVEEDEN